MVKAQAVGAVYGAYLSIEISIDEKIQGYRRTV